MNQDEEKPAFWEQFNRVRVAYQYYIAFWFAIPAFLGIIYEKWVEPYFLVKYIPTLNHFVLLSVVVGIPALLLLSKYHYERKPNRPKYELAKLDMKVNPWNRSIAQAITYLANGENEKAKEVLEEWV